MATWALIINEVVHETTDNDPKDRFPSDMAWVKCPASVSAGYRFTDGSFTKPGFTLDELKSKRVLDIRRDCEAAIVGGFSSPALGDPHTYPSNTTAQLNLMGSVTDSLIPNLADDWQTPFWVCDASGDWAYKMHSAAQIQQAGRAGKAHVVNCQTTLESLTVAVLAAETAEEVVGLAWPS